MHQPISVGKMVSFKEDKYFDPESKKFYTGVYVSAYVSKGAQDTWEKVLDGTLSGFSIGGRMNKYDDMYDEKMEKTIRVIKEYDLTELSLVDNPANQFANIMSIEKVDGVEIVKGLETEIENVFWDDENGIVTVSKDDSAVSPISGTPMKNIGFVETNDVEKSEMIKFLVDSAKGINLSKMNKEEDPMTETTEDVAAVADDVVVEDAQVAPEADATVEDVVKADEAEATKAEDMDEDDVNGDSDPEEEMDKSTDMEDKSYDEKKSETVDEVAEVSKADDVLANAIAEIQTGITSAFSDLSAVVKSLNDEIADLKKSLGVITADVASVKNDVTATKGELNEFGKGLDAVVADTAFRKSGDLGEIVQETQIEKSENSLWGGRFLKTADLFR
jgi:hypothetical protein